MTKKGNTQLSVLKDKVVLLTQQHRQSVEKLKKQLEQQRLKNSTIVKQIQSIKIKFQSEIKKNNDRVKQKVQSDLELEFKKREEQILDELQALKVKLKEEETRNLDIETDLEDLNELKQVQSDYATARREIKKLQRKLDKVKTLNSQIQEDHTYDDEYVSELENEKKGFEEQLANLKNQLKEERSKLKNLEKNVPNEEYVEELESEKEQLEIKLIKLEKRIEDLKEKNKELSSISHNDEDYEELERKNRLLEDQIQKSKEQIKKLKDENFAISQQNVSSEHLESVEEEKRKLQAELAKARIDLQRAQTKNSELIATSVADGQLQDLEDQLAQAQRELNSLKRENSRLKSEHVRDSQNESSSEELFELRSERDEAIKEVKELKFEIKKLKTQARDEKSHDSSSESEQELKFEIRELKEELSRLKKDNKSLRDSKGQASENLEQKFDETLENLKTENKRLKSKISDLQHELESASDSLEAKSSSDQRPHHYVENDPEIKKDLETAKATIRRLESENHSLKSQGSMGPNQDVMDSQRKLTEANFQITMLQDELRRSNAELSKLKASHPSEGIGQDSNQKILDEYESELAKLKKSIIEKDQQIKIFDEKIKTLQSEIKSQQDQNSQKLIEKDTEYQILENAHTVLNTMTDHLIMTTYQKLSDQFLNIKNLEIKIQSQIDQLADFSKEVDRLTYITDTFDLVKLEQHVVELKSKIGGFENETDQTRLLNMLDEVEESKIKTTYFENKVIEKISNFIVYNDEMEETIKNRIILEG